MMNPPNPSTDVGSLEGVRIAKHAMKKATKKFHHNLLLSLLPLKRCVQVIIVVVKC